MNKNVTVTKAEWAKAIAAIKAALTRANNFHLSAGDRILSLLNGDPAGLPGRRPAGDFITPSYARIAKDAGVSISWAMILAQGAYVRKLCDIEPLVAEELGPNKLVLLYRYRDAVSARHPGKSFQDAMLLAWDEIRFVMHGASAEAVEQHIRVHWLGLDLGGGKVGGFKVHISQKLRDRLHTRLIASYGMTMKGRSPVNRDQAFAAWLSDALKD